jgi:hypothetical protein
MTCCGTGGERGEHRCSYVDGGGDRDAFDIDLGLMADGRAVFPDELGVEGLFYTPEKYKYDYSIASTSASATASTAASESATRAYYSNSTRTRSSHSKQNRTSTALSVQTSLSPLAPLSSSASSSSSPSSPTSPPVCHVNKKSCTSTKPNPHPPQNRNTKPALLLEVQHILATFLLPSAPRELLLDGHVRDAVVARVARDGKAGVVSGPEVVSLVPLLITHTHIDVP